MTPEPGAQGKHDPSPGRNRVSDDPLDVPPTPGGIRPPSAELTSASERLERLEAAMTPVPWAHRRFAEEHILADALGAAFLRNALPELIAVVEAAEEWDHAESGYGVGTHDDAQRIEIALGRLREALADLNRALGEERA